MSLEKVISHDHSITESGHIQVRRITRIMEDGKDISKTYHRHVLSPGDDVEGQDERSKVIAQAVWTPEVVGTHRAMVAEAGRHAAASGERRAAIPEKKKRVPERRKS